LKVALPTEFGREANAPRADPRSQAARACPPRSRSRSPWTEPRGTDRPGASPRRRPDHRRRDPRPAAADNPEPPTPKAEDVDWRALSPRARDALRRFAVPVALGLAHWQIASTAAKSALRRGTSSGAATSSSPKNSAEPPNEKSQSRSDWSPTNHPTRNPKAAASAMKALSTESRTRRTATTRC
jgi:hypothetical protein